MMNLLIEIPNDNKDAFVHRFRNFGEDVYRALRDKCDISIDEIDASTTNFTIRSITDGLLPSINEALETIAKEHFFNDNLIIKQIMKL